MEIRNNCVQYEVQYLTVGELMSVIAGVYVSHTSVFLVTVLSIRVPVSEVSRPQGDS